MKYIPLLLTFLLLSCDKYSMTSNDYSYIEYMEKYEIDYLEVKSKMVPYVTKARIVYNDEILVGEIIEDRENGKVYHFKNDQIDEWIDNIYVTIIDLKDEDMLPVSKEELELYINYGEFSSKTEYFLYADLYRLSLYVFKRVNGYYHLLETLPCACGKKETPTKRGLFEIEYKGSHFYGKNKKYVCYNFLKYSGNYLLHSFPYTIDNMVIDNTIGRVSDGCLRFDYENSLYLFDTIPLKTSIYIN